MATSKITYDGYRPGETIRFSNIKATGRLVNAKNAIYVDLRLAKPISNDVSNASVTVTSGRVYVAGQGDKQIPANTTATVIGLEKTFGAINMTISLDHTFERVDVALADTLSGVITFS